MFAVLVPDRERNKAILEKIEAFDKAALKWTPEKCREWINRVSA